MLTNYFFCSIVAVHLTVSFFQMKHSEGILAIIEITICEVLKVLKDLNSRLLPFKGVSYIEPFFIDRIFDAFNDKHYQYNNVYLNCLRYL